jgi:signal transduction histidine kinase/FixJ family two-component response regulator
MPRSLRVLLVEDDEDDEFLLKRELRRCGYAPEVVRVETAEAMTEALGLVAWDVVIADYNLPRFSVDEALAILRVHEIDLPFIIVSGAVADDAVVAALRAGAHDFIPKGKWARLGPAIDRELAEAANRRERTRADDAFRFLAEVSKRLTTSLDHSQISRSIAEMAVPFLADWCTVAVHDDRGASSSIASACVNPSLHGAIEPLLRQCLPHDGGPAGNASHHQAGTVIMLDLAADDNAADVPFGRELRHHLRTLGAQSLIATWLVARRRVIGSLVLVRAESGRRFDSTDRTIVEELTQRVAGAIDNALLYASERTARADAERWVERLLRLQTITARIAAAVTVDDVTRTIVSAGITAAEADAALVALGSADDPTIEVVSTSGYAPEVRQTFSQERRYLRLDAETPITEAVRTGRPVALASESARAHRYPDSASIGYEAIVAVPLRIDYRSIGVLCLHFADKRAFDRTDLAYLETLADQCAQALERARLFESERRAVRVRDEFLSVAAHELRTPLTGLSLQAQLAQRRLERNGPVDPLKQIEAFRAINRQATKTAGLVNQLLDVSRVEAGRLLLERRPTDLSELVEASISLISERTVGHLVLSHTDSPIVASLDPLRIEQVVTNLVENAIKFTPEGGRIDVEVRRTSPSVASLSVTDNGIGIPIERRGQLFERFYRAHAESHQSGMGLGLFICRQIVELHGGKIRAEFPFEGGTRFVVELPLEPDASPAFTKRGAVE